MPTDALLSEPTGRASALDDPAVHPCRIARARVRLRNGDYDRPEVLDEALDAAIDCLCKERESDRRPPSAA